MPDESRTPLTVPLKRSAGQSTAEQLEQIQNDRVLTPIVCGMIVIAVVTLEWLRFVLNVMPHPIIVTAAGFICIVFLWREYSFYRSLRERYQLGLEGEREVSQVLTEGLPGYRVIDDIVFDGFNVDHALIGPSGIFSIETKTRRKYPGRHQVEYNGEKLTVAGFPPDRDPVVQAKAGAARLSDLIFSLTGQRFDVRPVVLFPGWFVVLKVRRPAVGVFNPKPFLNWVRKERQQLTAEQIIVVAEALKRHQAQETRRRDS